MVASTNSYRMVMTARLADRLLSGRWNAECQMMESLVV